MLGQNILFVSATMAGKEPILERLTLFCHDFFGFFPILMANFENLSRRRENFLTPSPQELRDP